MKCPHCGFVSFPGIHQCKKCGHPFIDSGEPSSPERAGLPAGRVAPQQGEAGASEWESEISGRVARFRQRRATLREPHGPELNLTFDFEPGQAGRSAASSPSGRDNGARSHELDVTLDEQNHQDPRLDSFSLPFSPPRQRTPKDPGASSLPQARAQTRELLDPALSGPIASSDFANIGCAPLGKRLIAGVMDAVLLLGAGCLFAVPFLVAGGRLQPHRISLAIVVLLAAFWLFAYFGLFSVITLSTPGQDVMGLAIRNWDGDLPTRRECLLRSFGYLVSIASLMLGFLWAAMDSDGLAWHDHISGTLLKEKGAK